MAGEMIARLVKGLRRLVHDLDPACLDGQDAETLLAYYAEGERLCAAAKTLLARRMAETRVWQREGHRTAADHLAATTGTTVGQARAVLDTADRLDGLPATEEALRAGRLSPTQAQEVASAAAEDPAAEAALLERATTDTVTGLRQHAAQVRANARRGDDETARYRRIHASRHVRTWTDEDGAGCGKWRLAPDAHARVAKALEAERDRIFRRARHAGRRESQEAYAADALVALTTGAADDASDHVGVRRGSSARPSPRTTVIGRVDVDLLHGDVREGQTCEIAGVGPVPVAAMQELLGDAVFKLVLTRGVDVLNVTHVGRTRTAAVQTALDWLFSDCGIYGCHHRTALEYHHTEPFHRTGHTCLAELVPLCRHHHGPVTRGECTITRRADGEYDLRAHSPP